MIICIDPGYHGCGVALFAPTGRLLRAGWPNGTISADRLQQATNTADAVLAWLHDTVCDPELCDGESIACDLLIIEWQKIYSKQVSRADPKYLLELAFVNGMIARSIEWKEIKAYIPRDWKGSLDGDQMVARIKAIMLPEELARVDDLSLAVSHNAFDAVGLGLKHFGRLERKRVIAR